MQAAMARAASAGESYDAVVVVVGLNDIKRAYRSTQFTAGAFGSELTVSCAATAPHVARVVRVGASLEPLPSPDLTWPLP